MRAMRKQGAAGAAPYRPQSRSQPIQRQAAPASDAIPITTWNECEGDWIRDNGNEGIPITEVGPLIGILNVH